MHTHTHARHTQTHMTDTYTYRHTQTYTQTVTYTVHTYTNTQTHTNTHLCTNTKTQTGLIVDGVNMCVLGTFYLRFGFWMIESLLNNIFWICPIYNFFHAMCEALAVHPNPFRIYNTDRLITRLRPLLYFIYSIKITLFNIKESISSSRNTDTDNIQKFW